MELARYFLKIGKTKKAWKELDAVRHLEILDPLLSIEYNALLDTVKKL